MAKQSMINREEKRTKTVAKYAKVRGFETAWQRSPVVFEWYGNWEYLKSRNWSFADSCQFMLDNHVTYINDNIGAVPPEQWPKIEKLARLAGYRLVLNEVVYSPSVQAGQAQHLGVEGAGVGRAVHDQREHLAVARRQRRARVGEVRRVDGV